MKAYICLVLALFMSDIPHVWAAETGASAKANEMISTADVVDQLTRAQTQEKIEKTLSRPELRDKLAKLGLSANEISKRLSTLSESELAQLDHQIDQARFGGDITGILIVVVLVLLIIYLAKRI